MISTWTDLEQLRAAGHKPGMPVIVTTNKRLCWNMHGVGCMTILHEAGTPMPLPLLEGLHVMLFLGGCEPAAAVSRALRSRGVSLANCEAWCRCTKSLTTCVGRCSDIAEAEELIFTKPKTAEAK